MNFNDKYLKKYSTFKLELQNGVRQEQLPETWAVDKLQPTLVHFLSVWHGAEVKRLSFYVEQTPLKVFGVIEFSQELRHKIDLHNPEIFNVTGFSFKFIPTDCDQYEKSPFDSWEEINAPGRTLIRFSPGGGLKTSVAFGEGVDKAIQIVNTLRDIGKDIYQVISAKRERNEKRLATINEAGQDLATIFKGTCNVFIHKNTDKHKGDADFYGVLFEDTFTIERTSYRVYIFREGTFSITGKCRREHHWFASGEDNNFARLSFWQKRLKIFRHPKRSFHFERQGKILSNKQLTEAQKLANSYFKPTTAAPPNDKLEPEPANDKRESEPTTV